MIELKTSSPNSGLGDKIVIDGTDISNHVVSYKLERTSDGRRTLTVELYGGAPEVAVAGDSHSFILSGVPGVFKRVDCSSKVTGE
jgi:hypothetical protein